MKGVRRFIKYIPQYSSEKGLLHQDSSYNDHREAMGWNESFKTKEEFLFKNFDNGNPPYISPLDELNRRSYRIIKQAIPNGTVLSIGSGGCGLEMKLLLDGYDVTSSDVELSSFHERLKGLFPTAQFLKFDVLGDENQGKFDAVIAISVSYLFNFDQMGVLFDTVRESLKKDGKFILSIDISPPHWISNLILERLLKLDTFLRNFYLAIKKKEYRFQAQTFGFRYANEDLYEIAAKKQFKLFHYEEASFESDLLNRFFLLEVFQKICGKKYSFHVFQLVGKILKMPYRRYFVFQVKSECE